MVRPRLYTFFLLFTIMYGYLETMSESYRRRVLLLATSLGGLPVAAGGAACRWGRVRRYSGSGTVCTPRDAASRANVSERNER